MAQSRRSAFGFGFRQEIVGIKALALQRHKQVARLDAAGVGVHSLHHGRAITDQLGIRQPLQGLLQRHHVIHSPAPGSDEVIEFDTDFAADLVAGDVQPCSA